MPDTELLEGELGIEGGFLCLKLIEDDAWKKANNPIQRFIINYFDECMTARYKAPDSVNAVFVDAGSDPEKEDQRIFLIEKYKTTNTSQNISVAISVSVKEEKFHMYCKSEEEIDFKKGPSPSVINGDRSDVIFFAALFKEGHDAYKFESSQYRDHYLAFKEVNGRRIPSLKRGTKGVDESSMFALDNNT